MSNIDHHQDIIVARSVSFKYGNHTVLDNVSLHIHKGDYLGIVGPNGGGKTTLLKIILKLLKPTSGTVELFDTNIEDFNQWYKIGHVPQKMYIDSLFPISVAEVIAMGLYGKKGLFRGLNKEDKEKVNQTLKIVDMVQNKNQLVGNLSGGQLQRVMIARALVADPEVIILDEPTSGIDVNAQEQFYILLRKLNREMQITLVLVSHDIDVVAHETTEVACINHHLVYHGSPKEFIKSDILEKLYGHDVKYIVHNH